MNKFKIITGVILIFTGVLIITTIIYNKIEVYQKQKQLVDLFTEETLVNTEKAPSVEVIGDTNSEEEIQENVESEENVFITSEGYEILSRLDIPKIGLSQVIVEGSNQQVLKYYVGHITGTAKPGEIGNIAIAAHNQSSTASVFQNLHKLEIGDEAKITTKTNTYTYKVVEKFIIDPTDVSVLNDSSESILTMITCCNNGKQRLIVKCFLAD